MGKLLNVFWYRLNEGHGNFGDELNPYIIERLSGKKVKWTEPYHVYQSKYVAIKTIIYNFIFGKKRLNEIFSSDEWYSLINKKVIFAIGSIIRAYHSKNIIVWGSGIISTGDQIHDAEFLAVRGKKTQERLEQLGLAVPNVIGDPAILLPIVKNINKHKKYHVGIIPHYAHYQYYKSHFSENEVLLINLLDDIEEILAQINSCEITLSTSLHGIIVSHSYGIRSLWVKFVSADFLEIAGDNVKFDDYFSSVDINPYRPIDILKFSFENNLNLVEKLKNQYEHIMLPDKDVINKRQIELLKVVPFRLLKEFEKITM